MTKREVFISIAKKCLNKSKLDPDLVFIIYGIPNLSKDDKFAMLGEKMFQEKSFYSKAREYIKIPVPLADPNTGIMVSIRDEINTIEGLNEKEN